MKNTRDIGSEYESKACNFLVNIGFKIVCTNFFSRTGEIDIVALDDEYLCFVEVKYRGKDRLASGLFAVDKKKQNKIKKAAKFYLYKYDIKEDDTPCRFDVVCIDGKDITLIKNAF